MATHRVAQSVPETFRKEIRARQARERRAADAARDIGIVYFIGSGSGPIKIGFTRDIHARLHRLQMNSPKKLHVLAAFYGSRADETAEHRVFAPWRLHGEWFKRCPEVLSHVNFWRRRTPKGSLVYAP